MCKCRLVLNLGHLHRPACVLRVPARAVPVRCRLPLLLDRRGARPTRDAAARPATDRSPDGTAGPAPAGRSTLREIIHLDLRRSPDPHPPAASLTPITHVPRYALLTIVF